MKENKPLKGKVDPLHVTKLCEQKKKLIETALSKHEIIPPLNPAQ